MAQRLTSPRERNWWLATRALLVLIYSAIVFAGSTGVLDECVQALVPGRVFDWRDIGFNVGAACMAVGGRAALALLRKAASPRA